MGTGIVKTGHKEYCVLCACYTFQPVPGSLYNVNLTLLAERRTFASDAFLLKGMVHVNTMLVVIDVFNDGEKPPTTPKFSRKRPVYFLKDKVQVQNSQGARSGIFKGQTRCLIGQERCTIGQGRCLIRQAKCPFSLGRCPIWDL